MNLHRTSVVLAASLTVTSGAAAQNTEFVTAVKLELNEQTGVNQVGLIADLPFGCDLVVEDQPTLSPAPVVSGPISVGEPFHNGGVLGYNQDDEQWGYGFPNFDNYGTQTLAEIDSLFGSGTYTFDVAGVPVALDLSGDLWPSSPPFLNLSGGFWSGGVYYVDESQPLTVNTSAFGEFGTNVEDVVWGGISGCDFSQSEVSVAGWGGANFLSFTIPAGSLTAGGVYDLEAGFLAASAFDESIPGLPGAVAAAGYERSTRARVVAVPSGGPMGVPYCDPAVANSTGEPGVMLLGGSPFVADNAVTLAVAQLPPGQFGFFLASKTQGFTQNPGGSQGNLCLGGAIGRYSRPGEIKSSGGCGSFQLQIDLTDTPQPSGAVSIQPGETWNFTAWYRDQNPNTTSNFASGVSLQFL